MEDSGLNGKIIWCLKQNKGIKLVKTNDNLCDAYLKKSNNSLKSMNLNEKAELHDWAVDAAYYARYHVIYALLQKCGIRSEIHDCSINLIKFLFGDKIPEDILKELETAKKQRIDLVYYTNRLLSIQEIKKNIESAPKFVLFVEKVISELNNIETDKVRQRLKEFIISNKI